MVATDGSSLADASYYGTAVPDIHTTREPKAPSEVEVLGSGKNGVTHQDSVAQQDSTYRLYVGNLAGDCKTGLDAGSDPCAWYAYIYPGPTQLADLTGAPYLLVKKDGSGKYYVDTYIPSTVANGSHRVVLTDGSGRIQGWTPVTVGEDADAAKAAEALYNEWGYPIVNASVQSRGAATDASLFTEPSWTEYKAAFASLSGKLSDVQKAALNNTADKAGAIAILAASDNVTELENQLHEAQKALVPANAQKVYRLKNPVNRKHVFTTDVREYEWNKGPGRNWVDETADGTFTVVPLDAVAGDTDANHQPLEEDPSASKAPAVANGFYRRVYRLYDTTLKRHFYTADKAEHDSLVKKNWRDEGIAWYTKDGGVTIYRGYSPTRFDWLFTTNKTEYDNATNAKGEGWYRGEPNGFTAVGETR